MPELPEVETTRRGIEPWLVGRRVERLVVRQPRLRWRVPRSLPAKLAGAHIRSVGRRAKYLLVGTDAGTIILHLGMSGSLRILDAATPPLAHDHVDLVLDSGRCLRFNDPRRFGCLLFTADEPARHKLLKGLAVEPLSDEFTGEALWRRARGRNASVNGPNAIELIALERADIRYSFSVDCAVPIESEPGAGKSNLGRLR